MSRVNRQFIIDFDDFLCIAQISGGGDLGKVTTKISNLQFAMYEGSGTGDRGPGVRKSYGLDLYSFASCEA